MNMLRRSFLQTAAGAAAAQLLDAAPDPPANVVFVLMDDLGWRDTGPYGNRFIDTPNLDRFARESVRFTNAYAACPVCSPTRAQHPDRAVSGATASDGLDSRAEALAHIAAGAAAVRAAVAGGRADDCRGAAQERLPERGGGQVAPRWKRSVAAGSRPRCECGGKRPRVAAEVFRSAGTARG